jgi:hypothetical protein
MAQTTQNLYHGVMDLFLSCFTGDALQRLLALRFPEEWTARADELGDKCNEGTLTEEERREYEAFVELGSTIAALQARAKRRASGHNAA